MYLDLKKTSDVAFAPETAEEKIFVDRSLKITALQAPRRFKEEWQAIAGVVMSIHETAMINVFIGREDRPLSSEEFPSLTQSAQYTINEKLSFLFYRGRLGKRLWKIRLTGNVFRLDTDAH